MEDGGWWGATKLWEKAVKTENSQMTSIGTILAPHHYDGEKCA